MRIGRLMISEAGFIVRLVLGALKHLGETFEGDQDAGGLDEVEGVQIGGIGALIPERRGDLARLGVRAMIAGTLANFLSASIAGLIT